MDDKFGENLENNLPAKEVKKLRDLVWDDEGAVTTYVLSSDNQRIPEKVFTVTYSEELWSWWRINMKKYSLTTRERFG